MKKTLIANLFAALTVFAASPNLAQAEFQVVDLYGSALTLENADAWGSANVDLEKGRVGLRVHGLTKNENGRTEDVMLSDDSTAPPTVREVEGYEVWLFRMEPQGDEYFMTDGLNLGVLETRKTGNGFFKNWRLGNLSDRGFNVLAVVAQQDYEHGDFHTCPAIEAFTWQGHDGMITLWGLLSSIP